MRKASYWASEPAILSTLWAIAHNHPQNLGSPPEIIAGTLTPLSWTPARTRPDPSQPSRYILPPMTATLVYEKWAASRPRPSPSVIHLLVIPQLLMNIFNLASSTTKQTDLKNRPFVLNEVQKSRGDVEWGC